MTKDHSRSWYAEDLARCLHPQLHDYLDAKTFVEANHEQVFGVYMRHETGQRRRKKLGKGTVWIRNGRAVLTRSHESATEQPLNNDAFVPCVDEMAALALEAAVHRYFGKTEKVHQAVTSRIDIAQHRWLRPGVNDEGAEGGTEIFGFEDCWDTSVDVFAAAIRSLTQNQQVNLTSFANRARYYQTEAAMAIADWLDRPGDREFYLLMKPRAGKNTTSLLGLAQWAARKKQQGELDGPRIVDFISLWPSAFEGCIKDIKDYVYQHDINIKWINTQDPDWRDTHARLMASDADLVIRFASMQSLDLATATEYNQDADLEGAEIQFDPHKVAYFAQHPASLAMADENDHGMRTDRSLQVFEHLGYGKILCLSGTDLYAIKHLVKAGNHYLYDLFQEVQDVLEGRIERRPIMRRHFVQADHLPFDDMDPAIMDQQEISRRLAVMLDTNIRTHSNDRRWSYDHVTDRYLNAAGDALAFQNLGEVRRYWDLLWFDWEPYGARSPESHSHVFLSMPSVASVLALYNHIREGDIECDHEPLIANSFKNPSTIERDVNDAMDRHRRTVFVTVGKMLRGAKAPWSAVVRLDDYSDFKVGLQLELRAQNTEEEWFDVYDANPFRASSQQVEMIRSRTDGKKLDTEGRRLHDLMPMTRKGDFAKKTVSWDDVLSDWQLNSLREGYRRMSLLDEAGVVAAQELLAQVDASDDTKKKSRDSRAGKLGQVSRAQSGSVGNDREHDELKEWKERALTISTMLPLLVFLTEGRYSEIDDLIDRVDRDVWHEWLDHCGIESSGGYQARSLIMGLFHAEEINNQLFRTVRRLREGGLEQIDWSEFNRQKQGDVTTPDTAVTTLMQALPAEFWHGQGKTFFDPSCGTGGFVVGYAQKLQELGHDPSKYIWWADTSRINLRLVAMRLGFDNGIHYNYPKRSDNRSRTQTISPYIKDLFMKKLGSRKFDLFATNPPFQSPDKSGRDNDNLWPAFLDLANKLTKADGHIMMITPGSWASLGTNPSSPGSKERKKHFDPKQVQMVDFTIGKHFNVGSTFTGFLIKNSAHDPNLQSELVFEDRKIMGHFQDFPCFSLWYSNSEFIDIIKRFRQAQHHDVIMQDPYPVARAAMPKKLQDGIYSRNRDAAHPYRAYHTNAQTHLYSDHKNAFHDQWKYVFSYSGSWKGEVTNDCSLTDASMCILCADEQEARSVQSVMESAPIKFLIDKVFRWGGYYNGLLIRWIPALPMTKIYTEDEIYQALFTPSQADLMRGLLAKSAAAAEAKAQAREARRQKKLSRPATKRGRRPRAGQEGISAGS